LIPHLSGRKGASPNLATVRLRTKVTKGAGSREAGMAMAFKLLDAAQAAKRGINGTARPSVDS
jgi:putative transposase